MQRLLFGLVVLLLLVPTAFASFEVTITDADSIYANETAVYHVIVNNTGGSTETIELDLGPDRRWSYETSPLTYLSPFSVDPYSVEEFDFIIDPISDLLSSGKYAVEIPFVSDLTGDVVEQGVILHIKNPNALTGYLPSLSFVLDAQEEIDPRNTARVKLEVRNRNPLNISEMIVDLESTLYSDTKIVPIEPLGSTTVIFEIDYDAHQEPVDDLLTLQVTVGETAFAPIRKEISIISYEDIVEYQEPSSSFFFKEKTVTEYFNNGNVNTTEEIRYAVTGFSRWFVSTDPAGSVVEDEGLLYYVTTIDIPVGETLVVTYTESYRSLVLLLAILGVALGLYYFLRSPVTVKKETVTLHVDSEGKMKIKVLLHLKNRSMRLVDDVEVIDRIPAVAAIEKHFEAGTVKPTKMLRHEKAGTKLHWHIHHLEAYEERIITYKVKSMYKIVGNLSLPAAIATFKGKKKNKRKVHSNKPKVGKNAD